ncbi:hypothetical protein L484_012293 [Morus notabilis]|uniref:Plant bHLH transcription factor ACT-like domain-containing protein n=1 Tax=Morus notabilis TaxID=981085 RepID=W9QCF8_9ROSA|nr:hypothetical protein L484_012293 [Morus notabilis]
MVSREHKRAALHEKLHLLRSITNSHALNETSIIVDASKYIEDLKQKVERLNRGITSGRTSSDENAIPASCQGLLVSVLEAFEELGLSVLEARVSCSDSFQLQAIGGENEEQGESMDAQAVKQAVEMSIKSWSETTDQA